MFILIFRDFNPEIHDVYKVAELIYDVDYRTFKHVFKSKEEGVEAIKNRLLLIDFAKDAEADENDLFYVFFDDEDTEEKEIIGMFNGGKGVQHSLFGDIKNQFKTLKFSEALGLSKVSFMMLRMMTSTFVNWPFALIKGEKVMGQKHWIN